MEIVQELLPLSLEAMHSILLMKLMLLLIIIIAMNPRMFGSDILSLLEPSKQQFQLLITLEMIPQLEVFTLDLDAVILHGLTLDAMMIPMDFYLARPSLLLQLLDNTFSSQLVHSLQIQLELDILLSQFKTFLKLELIVKLLMHTLSVLNKLLENLEWDISVDQITLFSTNA